MRGACESSELAELMAVEELADLGDQVSLADGKLRPGLFLEVFVAILDGGQVGADDQVLDQHLIGELLVAALDDDARRMALVGIFELVADVLRIAEIKFGADVGGAERRYHALVVGDAVAVEYGDDDRAGARFAVELAERGQRRLQTRDADREAGGRHRLAAEARNKPVITPAATDRTETNGAAFVVLYLEGEFDLVDRAGVIFETADDGGVDYNSSIIVTRSSKNISDLGKLSYCLLT